MTRSTWTSVDVTKVPGWGASPSGAFVLATVIAAVTTALASSASSAFAGDGATEAPASQGANVVVATLLSPTQGRPAFVKPGGTLRVVAQVSSDVEEVSFSLVATRFPAHRHELISPPGAVERLVGGRPVELTIPADTLERTYDLEIRAGRARLLGRHSVSVGEIGRRIRIVHLSNMNVGDAGAPDFDERLVEEVNLWAPTLIVATGDYLDRTHARPSQGWKDLSEFFARFDAPAVMACGDHDDLGQYSRFIGPSPLGVVEIGRFRAIVLYDVPLRSLDQDAEQIRWAESVLPVANRDVVTFAVSHAECPNLLRYWQRKGTLADMVSAGRLGLWFAGGHQDWDGLEYRQLIDEAAPVLYVRTHQASGATREGANGVSHYRVVDLEEDQAFIPHEAGLSLAAAPSIGVGRLTARFDGPNDGSRKRLAFSVVNNHPYRVAALRLRVLLKREGSQKPWCRGARLEGLVNFGSLWECFVRFDLPDKGTLRGLIGTGPEPPELNIDISLSGSSRIRLAERRTEDGVAYLSHTGEPIVLRVKNRGTEAVELEPLLRLDGSAISYRIAGAAGPFASAYVLPLAPGEETVLQLDFSALRVRPGRRALQVYSRGAVAWAPLWVPVEIVVDPRAAPATAGT